MNELTIFKNENFGEVRTITLNGEPWFVAKDVCDVFGETNRNRAMQLLDEDEKGYTQMNTPGGLQKIAVVNESGLYSLLFVMQPSKARGVKEEYIIEREQKLKSFKRWVTHDVIPQIRKSGMYIMAPKTYSDALRALANEVEEKALIKQQRDEAILTKTWISDKKTATAMNTASQKSKEVSRLKMELARSKEFASVKAVEKITKEKFNWREIRDYCTAHELEMGSTFDANYGSVRAYPAEAWWQIYRIDLKEIFADVTKCGDCYD